MSKENSKIKVLFISSWFPNRVKPTLGNFVQKHAEAVSLFADVSILHVCFDENLTEKKSEIVYCFEKNINSIFIYLEKNKFPIFRFLKYIKAYRKGLTLIKEKYSNPDIIHANIAFPVGLVFIFIKAFKKIPFVLSEHWTGYLFQTHTKIGFLRKYFIKRILKKAAMIMPVSADLKEAMESIEFKGKYKVVGNVVDDVFFNHYPDKPKKNKFKFLHVSSLDDRQKNISGIIRAIHQVSEQRKDFEVLIISDGMAGTFIQKARELNILNNFVFFENKKSTKELSDIMHHSDCLIMFSHFESFSIVIAESLASGLPIIATRAGGIAADISQEQGIIIKPGDETALINAMLYIIDHHDEYQKELLITFAKKFKAKIIGKEYLEIYKNVLKSE